MTDIDLAALEPRAQEKADLRVANLVAYAEIMMACAFTDLPRVFRKLAAVNG